MKHSIGRCHQLPKRGYQNDNRVIGQWQVMARLPGLTGLATMTAIKRIAAVLSGFKGDAAVLDHR